MVDYIEVKAQTRNLLKDRIKDAINQAGIGNNVVAIVMDEGGKFAGNSLLASIRAYIYYTV